jgi:hypothetical protein
MAAVKTKPESERRIAAVSESRYNAGVAHKRIWGSSTITRFFVWWDADTNLGGASKAVLVEGCGATGAERMKHAKARFRAAFACVDHEECRQNPIRSDACVAERLKRNPFNGAWSR